jgi:hypothetical protein
MSQVPFATKSDEDHIVYRLLDMGWSMSEINDGFAHQAKSNGDFTVDSVIAAMRELSKIKHQPKEKPMQPHQERVVTEKKELDEKIDKLSVFIKGDIYKALPGAEQMRLNVQLQAMNGYSNVLGERIAAFPK